MADLAAPPLQTDLTELPNSRITRVWNQWMLSLATRIQSAAAAVVAISLSAQSAAVPVTALIAAAAAGSYRVTVYARVTTAASVNSSLIPTITFIDNGITCTQSGAALVSNDPTLPASWMFIVPCDNGTPLSYSVAYVSNAAGMLYKLLAQVEQL